MDTNRNIIKIILLSLITFGIYGLYFRYKYIEDVNTICAFDGKKTNGLLVTILLSMVTCGIYNYVHMFGMAERLQGAGRYYNANVESSGAVIVLWAVFGSLLCGLGPIIALYLEIKNLNTASFAFNQAHMQNMHNNPPAF